jgi:hypothetical protein
MNMSQRHNWTKEESDRVIEGVHQFGIGKWSDIKKKNFPESMRTPVDIKDRYRNMTKVVSH